MTVYDIETSRYKKMQSAIIEEVLHRWALWISSGRQPYYAVLKGSLFSAHTAQYATEKPLKKEGVLTARGKPTRRGQQGSKPPPACNTDSMERVARVLREGLTEKRLVMLLATYRLSPKYTLDQIAVIMQCHPQTVSKLKRAAIDLIRTEMYGPDSER